MSDFLHPSVKRVFEEECGHMKIDAALIKRINEFAIGFVNKNEEHMTFFGGNLTGAQVVRFTTADTQRWFTDVMQVDDITLEEKLLALPSVNRDWHVSSDVFNLAAAWLIHAIMNSRLLNDKQKQHGMMDTALSLHYKLLTSLMYNFFPYKADPDVAQAAYAQLSLKFALKQHGSWQATLYARCESLLSKESIHYNILKNFDDDVAIRYLLNDTQSRIRDMMKNIVRIFHIVNARGGKFTSTSATVEFDGEEILKDKTRSLLTYTKYLHSIISDKNSFMKQELLDVINHVQHTMPPKQLVKTLAWVSDNYRHGGEKEIAELVDKSMTHSFSYFADHRNVLKETNDLARLVSNLRGVYMSSRSTDIELLEVRELAEKVVVKATGSRNSSIVASVRTGLLLYLVLRAQSMSHYS